jgi:hypothetical protein
MESRIYDRMETQEIEIVIEEIQVSDGKYLNIAVIIEEVSYKGVRFSTKQEFIVDEIIHFHLPSIQVESLIAGRIVWKKKLDNGHFQYGLQIIN